MYYRATHAHASASLPDCFPDLRRCCAKLAAMPWRIPDTIVQARMWHKKHACAIPSWRRNGSRILAAEASWPLNVHVRFSINQQIKSLITTNVCELSFALPEIWVRFGLRLIVGAGPCDFGLRGFRGPLRSGAGLPFVRRSGRRVGAHRELSRRSDRHQRHGADGTRL